MLSRATSWDGFLALRLPSRVDMNARPPQFLQEEMQRLLALEGRSTEGLRRYLEALDCHVPAEIMALFHPEAAEREARQVAQARGAAAASEVALTSLAVQACERMPQGQMLTAWPAQSAMPAKREGNSEAGHHATSP
eukprot:3764420-Karenia_brevis.AAC.1